MYTEQHGDRYDIIDPQGRRIVSYHANAISAYAIEIGNVSDLIQFGYGPMAVRLARKNGAI